MILHEVALLVEIFERYLFTWFLNLDLCNEHLGAFVYFFLNSQQGFFLAILISAVLLFS